MKNGLKVVLRKKTIYKEKYRYLKKEQQGGGIHDKYHRSRSGKKKISLKAEYINIMT